MINIKDLKKKDIGRWVFYRSSGGDKEQQGKLKSWNDKFIFVVYNANDNWDLDHWKDYTAEATSPEDLEFTEEKKYPKGKIEEDDEGETTIAVYRKGYEVIIDFGKDTTWIGLDEGALLNLIALLSAKYKEIKKLPQ